MNINISHSGQDMVIALGGRFTFAAHGAFRDVLTQHIGNAATGSKVTVDLSAVEFVDSAALGMLLLAREAAGKRSAAIALRGAGGQVRRMLNISRFESLFGVEP